MKRIFFSFFLFVVITILIVNFGFGPLSDKVINRYLAGQIKDYWRGLIKGTYHMVFVDLERLPEGQWDAHIDRLQGQFGYPIDLRPVTESGLSEAEQRRAMDGQLVVQGNGETFFMRAGASSHILVMGPIKDPDLDLFHVYLLFWVALLVILALVTLIWAMPFWRKLQRIITAAAAFGDGDFATRAQVPRRSALAPLADAFNRMAARIQELIDTQRELTNAVSHELRTPIARIRFSLEMLLSAGKLSDRKHYISEITKDVDELDELVTESLTYARFDRGAPNIDWQSCVVEEWVRRIARTALQGRVDIDFGLTNRLSTPDRRVFLEPRYMERAVGNLLQNAAKHANGQVTVLLEEDEGRCCIHVDDDGDGIPEADRERVFQAFTRLDNRRSRDADGHGLGLAIVRRVVDWHGGHVGVSDAPMGGARLSLCWPGFEPQVKTEMGHVAA